MKKIALFMTSISFVFACGGPSKKVEKVDQIQGENCCCKWTPMVSEDNKALFKDDNRMECSGKQGTCVDEIQCNAPAVDDSSGTPAPM